MILNGNDIKKLINENSLIENYNKNELYIGSSSVDLSISDKILKIKKTFRLGA